MIPLARLSRAFAAGAVLATATTAGAQGFKLTSKEAPANSTIAAAQVFKGFGCTGQNVSPSLSWSGAPAGTKSYALTMYDPDAPTGSGFWHWVVVNLPADTRELKLDAGNPKAGLLPKGALQTRTDFGAPGYGGPCPPDPVRSCASRLCRSRLTRPNAFG